MVMTALMTEAPVGATSCHKARRCSGPLAPGQTGSAHNGPVPTGLGFTGSAHTGSAHNDPSQDCCGPIDPGYTIPGFFGGADEDLAVCRRKCGCMRTSDKLKHILQTFPNPQPPAAMQTYVAKKYDKASGYGYGQTEKTSHKQPKDVERSASGGGKECCPSGSNILPAIVPVKDKTDPCHRCMLHRRRLRQEDELKPYDAKTSRSWQIVSELVSLVQLSVTATALALYYLIYCYMQLVYYTLRSALYFHNADGPMKITIGVVTLTSLIVGFNILMRMEGIIGIVY